MARFRDGPAFLAAAAADIWVPPANNRARIQYIHLANVTGAAATFNLYVGATGGSAAGTELFELHSIGAQAEFDHYCDIPQDTGDFLTGFASAASTIVILVTGYLDAVDVT